MVVGREGGVRGGRRIGDGRIMVGQARQTSYLCGSVQEALEDGTDRDGGRGGHCAYNEVEEQGVSALIGV